LRLSKAASAPLEIIQGGTTMRKLIAFVSVYALSGFCLAVVSGAGEPAKPWKNGAELSYINASGNTRAATLSVKEKFNYDWTGAGMEIEAGGLRSKNDGILTAEQYFAGEKVSWKWSERNYLFEKTRWDQNRFAGIDHSYNMAAGLGRVIRDTPKDKLEIEASGGYVMENRVFAPQKNDFGSGKAYVKYSRVLTETANFSQDAGYTANLKDSSDYRVTTETAVIASLSTHISFKTSYQWRFVNTPPAGFKKGDTMLLVALIFNF